MKNLLAKCFKGNAAIRRVLALVLVVAVSIGMSSIDASAAKKAKINRTAVTLYVGATTQLKLTGTKIKSVKTSKKSVATVTKAGKVTAKKAGTAIITLNGTNKKSYKCKVTVRNTKINKSAISLYVGKTYQLKLTGTGIKSVKTSNSKIATVTKAGKVTAKKAGTATITLIGKNNKNHTCKVTVKNAVIKVTGVKLSTTSPRVGATITTKFTPANANNVAKYAWYVLEKSTDSYETATAASTKSSYKVLAEDKDKYLQVVVTDKDGKVFASAVSSQISGEDLSAEVKIVDTEGLQANGTALPTDKLHLSYGAGLGTPDTIIWYKDGAAMQIHTSRGGFNGAFDLNTPATVAGSETKAAGEWYVVIQNTAGKNFTSNSIVVADVSLASIANVSAEDDYKTTNCGGLTFAAADDKVVLSATLNKDYNGTFYVYDADATSYGTGNAKAVLELTTDKVEALTATGAGTAAGKTGVITYAKKAGMTTEAANALASAYSTGAETAIKYIDPETGATTYMFVPEAGTANAAFATAGLVRGASYKVVFDQEGVDSDDISATVRNDVTASKTITIPYIKAPKAIKVEDVVASGSNESATVQLYADEAMTEKLSWFGNQATGYTFTDGVAAGATIKAYTNTKSSTSDGTVMTATGADYMKLGKLSEFTATAAASGLSCLYATATFDAGVWGAKKIELTSPIAGVPAESAGGVTTSYSKKDPNAIKVEFTGLKTEGKVYVVRTQRASSAYTENDIVADINAAINGDQSVIAGTANVTRGTESVTVSDCVPRIYTTNASKKDAYSAIFVPTNRDDFQIAKTTVDTPGSNTNNASDKYCIVEQKATTYAISGTKKRVGNAPAAGGDTDAVLEVFDQFGNAIDSITAIGSGSSASATTVFSGTTGAAGTQAVTIGVDTDRRIYAKSTFAGTGLKGDTYKYKLEDGWFICFTLENLGSDAATTTYSISVTNS